MKKATSRSKSAAKMTAEELMAAYEARQQEERAKAARQDKVTGWMAKKEEWVEGAIAEAKQMQEMLIAFKATLIRTGRALQQEMLDTLAPGTAPADNVQLCTEDKRLVVEFAKTPVVSLDATAQAGIALIEKYMEEKVKSRSLEAYKMLAAILTKGRTQDYDAKLLVKLNGLQAKGVINDPDFAEGLRILNGAAQVIDSAEYVRFHERDGSGKLQPIVIQFSAL